MLRTIAAILFLYLAAPAYAVVDLLDYIPDNEEPLLLTTGGLDDDGYVAAAQAAAPIGDIIVFPPGLLNLSEELPTTARQHFLGAGGGLPVPSVTRLQFPPNSNGIVVQHSGTIIEGLYIGGSGTSGVGILQNARASIKETIVNGFGGDCIVADGVNFNLNHWFILNVRAQNCGGDGLDVDGADSNAGTAINFNAVNNGGWGVRDSSFLGNTYIGPHAANNALGPYYTDNPSARNVFIGAYSEGGQGPSSLVKPTVVIGGLLGGGVVGTAQRIWDGAISPFKVLGADGKIQFNSLPQSFLDVLVNGDHIRGWSLAYWDAGKGVLCFRHGLLSNRQPLCLTTELTIIDGQPLPPGRVVMEGTYAVVDGSYQYIVFAELYDKIAELEARVEALENP